MDDELDRQLAADHERRSADANKSVKAKKLLFRRSRKAWTFIDESQQLFTRNHGIRDRGKLAIRVALRFEYYGAAEGLRSASSSDELPEVQRQVATVLLTALMPGADPEMVGRRLEMLRDIEPSGVGHDRWKDAMKSLFFGHMMFQEIHRSIKRGETFNWKTAAVNRLCRRADAIVSQFEASVQLEERKQQDKERHGKLSLDVLRELDRGWHDSPRVKLTQAEIKQIGERSSMLGIQRLFEMGVLILEGENVWAVTSEVARQASEAGIDDAEVVTDTVHNTDKYEETIERIKDQLTKQELILFKYLSKSRYGKSYQSIAEDCEFAFTSSDPHRDTVTKALKRLNDTLVSLTSGKMAVEISPAKERAKLVNGILKARTNL